MNLSFKYDIHLACKKIIQKELNRMGLSHSFVGAGEVVLERDLSSKQFYQLKELLLEYGIIILDNKKDSLVEKIKNEIMEMIYLEERLPVAKTSHYLAEKLNLSYGYLSNLFSEVTLTTIENFIIIQKIERAKDLLIAGEYNLTEIAYKLNYSSVAHLSNQFKKTTGLSPSLFSRIIKKRKLFQENNSQLPDSIPFDTSDKT